MDHGVPQGSVLGPILFLIYINDLTSITSSHFVIFADDTTIIQSHKNIDILCTNVKGTVLETQKWFAANQLSLNRSKTEKMIFSLRNITELNDKDSIKFLGVYLDKKLSWEQHAHFICNKVSVSIYLLRNLANIVSQKTLITAYHGLIHSTLSYAILIWGHSTHSASVFALQRKAVRILYGLNYRDDCRQAFKNLKILTLPSVYILQCLLYIKEHASNYTSHNEVHSYSTRNNNNIYPNFLRLSKTRNGPNYYALKFFNYLPAKVKELDFKSFKNTIRAYLMTSAFYNFEEFLSSNINNMC